VVALEIGEAIGIVALASLNQLTGFPLPPFTVFAKVFKSKEAVPEPSSHCSSEVALAVKPAPTSKLTGTDGAVQFPSETTAYTVVVAVAIGEASGIVRLASANHVKSNRNRVG